MRVLRRLQVWGFERPFTLYSYNHRSREQIRAGYRSRWHDRWPKVRRERKFARWRKWETTDKYGNRYEHAENW